MSRCRIVEDTVGISESDLFNNRWLWSKCSTCEGLDCSSISCGITGNWRKRSLWLGYSCSNWGMNWSSTNCCGSCSSGSLGRGSSGGGCCGSLSFWSGCRASSGCGSSSSSGNCRCAIDVLNDGMIIV